MNNHYPNSSQNHNLSIPRSRYLHALGIFGSAIIAVYFLPQSFARIYFIIFFIYAYTSKRYGILAGFYSALLMNPVYLFKSSDLPIFSLGPGASFGIFDILGLILLIKAFKIKKNYLFKKNIIMLFILVGIFFFISFFDGSNITTSIRSMRSYIFLSSYFIFAAFLQKKGELNIFINICLTFAILGVIDQIFALITKKYFLTFITGKDYVVTFIGTDIIRSFPTSFLIVYFALVYILSNPSRLKIKLNNLFLAIFTISILLSSTRQWLINIVIIFVFSSIFIKTIKKKIFYTLIICFVILITLNILNVVDIDYIQENVMNRYATIPEVVFGDYESVYSRIVDFKQVGKNAREHFFFGMGFRADYTKISNDISGFLNNIVRFGIFGALLFTSLFFSAMKKIRFVIKRTQVKYMWVLHFVWLALLIQFFVVYDFFSFGYGAICLITMLLAYTEITMKKVWFESAKIQ